MSTERTPSEVAASVATDAEVLEAASRELHVGLEGLSAERLAGDASSRVFFRIRRPGGTVVAVRYPRPFSVDDGSTTRFERWCHEHADGRLTFANDPLCQLELTSLFARFDVPVPEILAVSDRHGIVFMSDAGDDLLQSWSRDRDERDVTIAYDRAVDLVANVRSATSEAIESGVVAGRIGFDADKLGWELEFWRANTFERFLPTPLAPDLDGEVRRESRALAEALADRPRFLCHRDYHARNLLVLPGARPDDGLVVIDFQDARLGPLTYDLVSLVEDPYADLDPERRARLRERFALASREDGSWPGDDAFAEEYDLMAAQRLLKAVGTYTNQAAVRGKTDYVPYVAPACAAARTALERLGRYPSLVAAVDAITEHTQ